MRQDVDRTPVARTGPVEAPSLSTTSTLEDETEILERAQLAMGREEALVLLAEHARRYPNGLLRRERLAAEVFALCGVGQTEAARAAADGFVREFPAGPLAERVRTSCVARMPVRPLSR